jgi:hypothetical protein
MQKMPPRFSDSHLQFHSSADRGLVSSDSASVARRSNIPGNSAPPRSMMSGFRIADREVGQWRVALTVEVAVKAKLLTHPPRHAATPLSSIIPGEKAR